MTTTDATSVSATTEADAPLARAFHVLTAEIGTWWDKDKHLLDAPLGRRNMALVEVGLLSGVLPVADDSDVAGFGVFATDPDQTRSIMDDDPGVLAGIFVTRSPVRAFPGAALP